MCSKRVEAHDGRMSTSYEITKALVLDRQQQLLGEAKRHRLARTARRARARLTVVDAEGPTTRVLHLVPREPRTDAGEERAAS
jgi:hypothetical protein